MNESLQRRICRWAAACAALLILAVPTVAQQPTKPPTLGVEAINTALSAAKDAPGLSEGDRTATVESLTKALAAVQSGDQSTKTGREFLAAKEAAPQRLRTARAALAKPAAQQRPAPAADASLADLEQQASTAAGAAQEANTALEKANERIRSRAERHPQLPRLIEVAREQLATARSQLDAAEKAGGDSQPLTARRTELLAQVYALTQEVFALESELASLSGADELLTAERDLAKRQSDQASSLAAAWQLLVQQRRAAEAQAAQEQAASDVQATKSQHPLLAELAQQNERLTKLRTQIAKELTEAATDLGRAEAQLRAIDQDFRDVSNRVTSVRLTAALGALLRDRRTTLPDRRPVRARIATTQERISSLQFERVEIDDAVRSAQDPNYLDRLVAFAPTVPGMPVDDLQPAARNLLSSRLETVLALRSESSKLFDSLIRLDAGERRLLAKITEYVDFVNARILWARSTTPIWQSSWQDLVQGGRWLFGVDNWSDVLGTLGRDVRHQPSAYLLPILLLLALGRYRKRLHSAIVAQGDAAERTTATTFKPTAWSLVLTLFSALPGPALVLFLGWRLQEAAAAADFTACIGHGLQGGALWYLAMNVLRHIVRPKGLAASHFAWSATAIDLLRAKLPRLMALLLVSVVFLNALDYHSELRWREAIGRPLLLVALTASAAFGWQLLHPRTGLLGSRRVPPPTEGLAVRFRVLLWALAVVTPLALLVLDILGFHFTAKQLGARLALSGAAIVSLLLLHDVALRALVLARRRLGMQQAAERRKATAALKAADASEALPSLTPEEPIIDVSSIAAQTRTLAHSLTTLGTVVAIWLAWVDVLPALGVLQDVTVWSDITLADAIFASIVLVMTFLAARNIPGVLHLTVLQRLRTHEGERHAIATIARYAIILIGCVYAFSTLGLAWSKVQWLAAGISVGLGFGLQEIFANFVSGLIILFERPVRVGDLVTVGGVDGYVTRIQMRSTTVRDYNRKELVIPNKEFITTSIVNWTLSDAVTRLVIKVGVAYGSDTRLCREILLRVAKEDDKVLESPKPKALFMSFGESSLDFQLRVFTANVDVWPEVIDGLHYHIDMEFRKAGIEIAFPQRDLHIRSAAPLAAMLKRAEADEDNADTDS